MRNIKIVHVPHLGGIDAAYQMPFPFRAEKPTLVLVNAMTTSSELYRPQFDDARLNGKMNLIAIEPLGHGQTRAKSEHFTYWDTAIMNLQVMDALGIQSAFALGTSQGGWIVARMALLAPEKIQGIIPLGTSMDYESPRSLAMGNWDGLTQCAASRDALTTAEPTPEFRLDDSYAKLMMKVGFGKAATPELESFWTNELRVNYAGDDGRRRCRMCWINLGERDGLHGRLRDIKCPVLWLHGSDDAAFSVRNAEDEIKMFTNAKVAGLTVVPGGAHYLSASHPKEVGTAVMEFVDKHFHPE
ncbi:hypothetical protein G647_03291 [Cladophialophora carrionii CBS 160.54]|uniref:AB hydrolase-1 domain-containing protein n=1 Tax=Cladophialophora carrionii CBS 160.54 TaxID=1279043 RepID=V9DHY9_9EURO|nr:uncharacterized protein G647_03291 [Cladophialophora carrionii CBS 160.54]ETI26514.1 hypothetical protein G647_03291 [Cladophialophora carrionii CBS 160.54]